MADGSAQSRAAPTRGKSRRHVVPSGLRRAYRVRAYPRPRQAKLLRRIFGARRFVWKWALARKERAYRAGEKLPWSQLSAEFTKLRAGKDTGWLGELPVVVMQQTLRDLRKAYAAFFNGVARHPRPHRYGSVQSARFQLDQRKFVVHLAHTRAESDRPSAHAVYGHGVVQLPGVGPLRFRVSESMPGELLAATVSQDAAGRWFISFAADGVPMPAWAQASRWAVGVDLGLKDAAVLSDGTSARAPKHLKRALVRLRRYQRHFARERDAAAARVGLDPHPQGRAQPKLRHEQWSHRMRTTQRRIGILHARIADQRRNFQHQLTRKIVGAAEVICIEDLAVKGMGKSMRRAFRRSVADAGLGEIRRQIEYKAAWYGRCVSVVNRWFPSSQLCSTPGCGYRKYDLELKDRTWVCPRCGVQHQRDPTAAENIEVEGVRGLMERYRQENGLPGGSGEVTTGERMRARRAVALLAGLPNAGTVILPLQVYPGTVAKCRMERREAGAG